MPHSRSAGRVAVVLAMVVTSAATAAVAAAQDDPVDRGARARSLSGGWGTAWKFGIPGWGKTTSDVEFVSFHPGLGWFVRDGFEIFGEATLMAYYTPARDITAGLAGLGGRVHFAPHGRILPFVSGGAGLVWTSIDVGEIDRVFNGQLFYGAGVRWRPRRNPGLLLELRNHHISNAGTKGDNLGLNAFMIVAGVEWLLAPRRGS